VPIGPQCGDSYSYDCSERIESIETGQHLTVDPGKGAGLFVEYDTGGFWHVFATCDSATSVAGGASCNWDLIASVDPSNQLTVPDQSDLERNDGVYSVDSGAVHLIFNTDVDIDGVGLATQPPGIPLTLDVKLDDVHDSSFVSWISGGAVQTGTSDPAIFTPTTL
jgi:hypothetical protein